MSSPLPPDPYAALGLAKDATAAQIKTTYRKLALKCHPDKVSDESQKTRAADEFHRIQQAYEILGDEDRKSRYDVQVRLAELRRDVMERQFATGTTGGRSAANVKTAAFEVPISGPGRTSTAFTAKDSERVFEERKPAKGYESEDYFPATKGATRKHSDYDRTAKKTSPRDRDDRGRAKAYEYAKENEKTSRSDRRRTRDKETKRERDMKYPHVEEDTESDDALRRREAARRKNDDVERERYNAQSRKVRESPILDSYSASNKYRSLEQHEEEALAHMAKTGRSRGTGRAPPLSRTMSSRDTYPEIRRTRDGAPVMVRRSSARPKSPSSKRERTRKFSVPDIDDDFRTPRERQESRDRRVPPLTTSTSSPAAVRSARDRATPLRTQSLQPDLDPHDYPQPTPQMRRSETMPTSSPRRKDSTAPGHSSKLRPTEFASGFPTPSTTPDSPSMPSATARPYRYPNADAEDAEYSTSRKPVTQEAPFDWERGDRRITRSPSPFSPRSSRRPSAAPQPPLINTKVPLSPHPSMDTPSGYSTRSSPGWPLYGEVSSGGTRRTIHDYSGIDREREREPLSASSSRYKSSPDLDDSKYSKRYTGGGSSSTTLPFDTNVRMTSGGYPSSHYQYASNGGRHRGYAGYGRPDLNRANTTFA